MEVSIYPGCSLEGLAKSYMESVEAVSKTLGIELRELANWTCCGSASAHVMNDDLAVALAARNLGIAEKAGMDLVVPCAACYQRLKVAEKHLRQGKPVEGLPVKYEGSFQIRTMPDFFWENVGEKALIEKVKNPLQELNPVCYYGCLTSRPPKITDAKNPEDPQEMDRVLRSLGANVKNWSFKADCCGGDLTLTRPDLHMKLTQRILDMAIEAGADCIAVACPMCHENLDSKQAEISQETGRTYNIPIFYFTELMGLAFGDPAAEKWLSRHTVDPLPLLREKGLLEMQVRR
ncbi:MAG: CoB--CoM heterodisulfide reductase iron-sulfur subunit B family protein [Dehalococcoidia bacterium]|nr:MAG: CoB--CoM heterodisulfide reductase iron-sulfur subunit B family protein [Dehalococcoidia bacterium]